MNEYIKCLIKLNKDSINNITILENILKTVNTETPNGKVEFGYLCVVLESLRTIAFRTEHLLNNNDIIKTEEGDFYSKIDNKA